MVHKVRQVELARDDRSVVVWIDADLPVRPGVEVTGKDRIRWRVAKVYAQTMEPHLLNRGWSVGGLL